MINLLPPAQKEQMRYAKLNRLAMRYVWVSVVVLVVLGAIFAGSFMQLDQQVRTVSADVKEKQDTIAVLNRSFTPKAKDASDRLDAIKYVQGTQTRFSAVISDIAKVVPKDASIDSLTLTGNDAVPVKLSVTAKNYAVALAFRNALITSPRIAGADLENITSTDQAVQTSIVIAFKPGQAK
jgi:Tfp pilus assembly protein PilN